jgi:CDP-diacylglycerol--glycerol-3-phosphate 3-phosphatidyltransferase
MAANEAAVQGSDPAARAAPLLNVPNILTLARLVCCIAFFAILIYCSSVLRLPVDAEGELHWRTLTGKIRDVHATLRTEERGLALLFDIAFGIFLVAALTDILDGQIARRYDLVTDLGRIADPFVDKIMILGAFTLLMPLTVYVTGWMVVLVLARELLVSGIRGFAESRGIAFPATFWGKTKMVSQTITVAAGVFYVGHPEQVWIKWVFLVSLWWTLAATVISGVVYLNQARSFIVGSRRAGAAA